MPKYKLRKHQAEMEEQIESSIMFGEKNLMVDACPAFGKSLQIAEVARKYQKDGVIILINITALLDQISEHLTTQGVEHSILKANHSGNFDPDCKVQLVMSQTLYARLDKVKFKHTFKIYQQDEGHREHPGLSQRTTKNIDFINPEIKILYSGTCYDQAGFRFNDYEYLNTINAIDLQEQGFLCPIKYYVPQWSEKIDYSSIKKSGNDYNSSDLDKIINTKQHLSLALKSMNELNAKNKKTIVFCSGIEQCDMFTEMLKQDGFKAEAYHSKSEFSDRVINAFKTNSTYNKEKQDKEGNLFADISEPEEFTVNCIVSISRLGIGFDSPHIQLAVQLRPTKVRSLFIQQVMRAARIHSSKQFAEYLDCGQTTSNFGFHTDIYNPPTRTGDKKIDNQNLQEANHSALEDLTAVLDNNLTEMTREIYNVKVEKVKESLKQPLEELDIETLARAFDMSKDHKELITIACLIYTYKFGKPKTKKGHPYNYKPESFWGTNTFGANTHFHVHLTMQEYFNKYPDQKPRLIKSLRTRLRNIIKQGDHLFKITGFIKFLIEKYEEDQISAINEFRRPAIDIDIGSSDEVPF